MEALKLLFTSDIGLLSVFTVAFAIAMVTYIYRFLRKEMDKK